MVSLKAALEGVKQCIVEVLSRPVIELACRRHGHTWDRRINCWFKLSGLCVISAGIPGQRI